MDAAVDAFLPPLQERPQPGADAQLSNDAMADRILSMPLQPYRDGTYVVRVAEIRGRKSGTTHRVPIAITQMDGNRYLVSPKTNRSWVLNLRAEPKGVLLSNVSREEFNAVEAEPEHAVAVLRLYLSLLRWAAAQFPFSADDSDSTIRSHLDEVAVFRVVSGS